MTFFEIVKRRIPLFRFRKRFEENQMRQKYDYRFSRKRFWDPPTWDYAFLILKNGLCKNERCIPPQKTPINYFTADGNNVTTSNGSICEDEWPTERPDPEHRPRIRPIAQN